MRLRVGDGYAAGLFDPLPGHVWLKAIENQDSGGEKRRSSDAGSTMGDDVGTCAKPHREPLQVRENRTRIRNATIRDRQRYELQTGVPGLVRFGDEVDVVTFGVGQGADEDVDPRCSQGGHLISEPVTTTGFRHGAELPGVGLLDKKQGGTHFGFRSW